MSTGAITYLVADSLGSVRGAVSSSGTLTGTTSYDTWGNPETTGGLTATTPFGYAGGYTDPSGLIYLLARYYDPATGQFISLDPAISQTLAPYEYADSNPVSQKDPSGLSTYVGVSWYGPTLYMSEWLVDKLWNLANGALFGSVGLRLYAGKADKLLRTIGSVDVELDVHWVEVFCWEIALIGWGLWA